MIYQWKFAKDISLHDLDPRTIPQSLTTPTGQRIYARRFLGPDAWMEDCYAWGSFEDFVDPGDIPEMAEGAQCLYRHLSTGGSICIFCDYDVDGICGGVLLYKFLKLAYPNHNIHILHSDRFSEGYGLHMHHVEKLLSFSCIITVDCGSNSLRATESLTDAGCDVIITDHHECALDQEGNIIHPKAKAFINPKRQDAPHYYAFLSGTGVALMMCLMLRRIAPACHAIKLGPYLDLVCTSIVADSVPLINENRMIVQYGLKLFNQPHRLFFQLLIDSQKRYGPIDESTLSYALIPKLNAPGRLGSTEPILQGLLSNKSEEITACVSIALSQNQQRMEVQHQSWSIVAPLLVEKENHDVICIYHPDIHEGVLGILASRISEKTQKPSLVLCSSQNRDEIKGSGRSYGTESIYDIVSTHSGYFKQYGGHRAAVGLTLPKANLEPFLAAITKYRLPEKRATLTIEDTLEPSDISLQTALEIQSLGPYGQAFEEPHFVLQNMAISKISLLNENHLKGTLECSSGKRLSFVGWKLGSLAKQLPLDQRYDVALKLKVNYYLNIRRAQCEVIDFHPTA